MHTDEHGLIQGRETRPGFYANKMYSREAGAIQQMCDCRGDAEDVLFPVPFSFCPSFRHFRL